jgi:hypothetical protein
MRRLNSEHRFGKPDRPDFLASCNGITSVNEYKPIVLTVCRSAPPPGTYRSGQIATELVLPVRTRVSKANAESCRQPINTGMAGHEDEILMLISVRGLQLPVKANALVHPRSLRTLCPSALRGRI